MKYKILGKTGIEVSELCMGTMSFGGHADEKESAKMFNQCRDAGINFLIALMYMKKGNPKPYLANL